MRLATKHIAAVLLALALILGLKVCVFNEPQDTIEQIRNEHFQWLAWSKTQTIATGTVTMFATTTVGDVNYEEYLKAFYDRERCRRGNAATLSFDDWKKCRDL